MNAHRIWILGTAVVIAAVLGLGWLLGVSPLLTGAATADTEREAVVGANAAQAATLELMRQQFEDIDGLRAELDELRESIPSSVDPAVAYALLSQYQAASGARVETITTGEAMPYGGQVTDPATGEASTEAPAEGAPATGEPAEAVPMALYTVPVTITFKNVSATQALTFASLMQKGSRLFLVTEVSGSEDGATATITAHMFVLYEPPVEEIPAS